MTTTHPATTPSTGDGRPHRARPEPPEAAADRRDHPLEKSQKSYHTILEQQVSEATEELERPTSGLLLSGLTAGLDLGFGPFAMVVFSTLTARSSRSRSGSCSARTSTPRASSSW
jgi:hypothetical protein